MIRFIDPIARLGSRLLEVEKPARYTGGEYGKLAGGSGTPDGTIPVSGVLLQTAVVFPDLYELGMSNQAFRILYNTLNRMEGVSCDRAFAPSPDFEDLLKKESVPLYGLDTGIALADTDLLLVTLGYELGITGLLSVLDASGIALRSVDRSGESPVVIMGGPCVSNPLPYSRFVDAFWIGEAEGGFFDLVLTLRNMKQKGARRQDLLESIAAHPHVWTPGKSGVRRALEEDFGQHKKAAAVFPVSSIKTVQHHGAVEIMRGCPNGCRFCHAGMWYRPMRQKQAGIVMDEAEAFITQGGYREISLSSLSSGDYCGLNELVTSLNNRWNERCISFQLPSLRVSGFSLPILASVSEVRKSGLTFAVETPAALDQLSLNKQVSLDEVRLIIGEAHKRGWRGIKFYFMIGLPLGTEASGPDGGHEEERIAEFIMEAGKTARTHFHVNAGTFVPKPHTPYQRAAQLNEDAAWKKLRCLQDVLKPRGHKVSVHNPFISLLEGIIARGDERTGELVETAYRRGCRLDAWSEHFRMDLWKTILAEHDAVVKDSIRERKKDETLPWNVIQSGVGEAYLEREKSRSEKNVLTAPCMENCDHPCGVCGNHGKILTNNIRLVRKTADGLPNKSIIPAGTAQKADAETAVSNEGPTYRMLFTFSKTGPAVFIPHLGVIEVFSAALVRSGIRAVYTRGFNPLPKLDFASPAALGLFCRSETASVDLEGAADPDDFINRLNRALPEGFTVTAAEMYRIPRGTKKRSVSALLWGFRYGEHFVPATEEKTFRASISCGNNIFGLVRDGVLAKNPAKNNEHIDYFSLYETYYPG